MNYQKLKTQVLERIQKQQGGKTETQPTLQTVQAAITGLNPSITDLSGIVAIEMCRDILSEQGVPEDQINKALETA